jgi:hypothetical protein
VLSTSPSTSISFETTFIFSIEYDVAAVPTSYDDGLMFSIASESATISDPGAFLGLAKATLAVALPPSTNYFALKFETHQGRLVLGPERQPCRGGCQQPGFHRCHAYIAAQFGTASLALALGTHIQANVTYNSLAKVLNVSLAP